MPAEQFDKAIASLERGQSYVYYIGNLAAARNRMMVPDAAAAWHAMEYGRVNLVQRRVGHGISSVFEYIAQVRR